MRKGLSHSAAGKLGGEAAREVVEQLRLQRIEEYNRSPVLCKNCAKPIEYGKHHANVFCNHSCAATLTSKGPQKHCAFCNKEIATHLVYCSRQCQKDLNWAETKAALLEKGFDTSDRHLIAKRYLIELHQGKCQMCGNHEWLGKPIALVLDHIDGNSDNGSLTNLRVICNNCDATTDTYKAKNKGKGRASRRERYKLGKSY